MKQSDLQENRVTADYARTLHPRQIREQLQLSRERMARLLDVTAKTIERWEGRDVPTAPRLQHRLASLHEIAQLGMTVYTAEGFRQFLTTPLPEFEGRTALQLIELDEAERVLAALAADYEGLGS